MDDRRSADALTDAALDRELEAALAVDPSPEFVARVRTRVQTQRNAAWSALPWGFAAAAGAIVVVAAVVVGMSRAGRFERAQDLSSGVKSPVPNSQDLSPAPPASPIAKDTPVAQDHSRAPRTTPRNAVAPSTRRNAPRNEPEMLVSADEARALRRLFADVRKGLIDLSSLQEVAPATAALQPPSEIAFAPIVFEPIAPETAEEGERQ